MHLRKENKIVEVATEKEAEKFKNEGYKKVTKKRAKKATPPVDPNTDGGN